MLQTFKVYSRLSQGTQMTLSQEKKKAKEKQEKREPALEWMNLMNSWNKNHVGYIDCSSQEN